MIQGTPGFLGTGIWPYRLSRFIGARNIRVGFGGMTIDHLSRDYISFLYLPLIPLSLSALASFGSRRIPLDQAGKNTVLRASMSGSGSRQSERELRLGRVRANWLLAFLVAACGAGLGYWLAGYFAESFPAGLWTILGGILGCGIMNCLYLAMIG